MWDGLEWARAIVRDDMESRSVWAANAAVNVTLTIISIHGNLRSPPRGHNVGAAGKRKLGPPNFGGSCSNTKNSMRVKLSLLHYIPNMAARTLRIGKTINWFFTRQ